MKKLFILVALLLGTMINAGPVSAAPVEPVAVDLTLPGGQFCEDFTVQLVATGKGKEVDLPGDRTILIAPGLKATFTNTTTGKSVTFVVTGATHTQTLANGDVVSTVTGRNVLINNDQTADQGLFLVVGTFRFTLDADGNEVDPFTGTGQVTDVCNLLA